MNIKKTIAIAVIIILAVGMIMMGARVIKLVPEVQDEKNSTPTPSPIYGNVLIVTPDPNAPTSAPLLKRGYEGEAVAQLQTRLAELGYYTGEIDGQYGNGTVAAVTAFQEQHNLSVDGIAGQATLSTLYSDAAKVFVATNTPVPTQIPTVTPTVTSQPISTANIESKKPYVREDGLPLLVNKTNPLPNNYQPYDLINMADYCDSSVVKIKYSSTTAEREAVDALMVMLRAAISDGITVWQVSAAYRDMDYQQQLFDNQVNKYIRDNNMSRSSAIEATKKTVAEPGTSEHHIGTAFDITVPGTSFAGTAQAKWLAENCWNYGFILRYAKDKESITGYLAEAWHFRYVGTEHSLIMRDENLCLEEYITKYGISEVTEEWLD